ncbi:MAG: twin-arginine translocase subunit TatC [Acidimicrobiales bacterium]
MAKFRKAASGMTLSEHLAEARYRFMVSLISVFVFGTVAFIFYPEILKVLQEPYCRATPQHCTFLVTNPLDGLTLRIKIGVFGGFLLSSPIIFWQAWRFITPGLKAKERRYAVPFVASSILFFSGGVAVAYFIFGRAIKFLEAIGGHSLVTYYNPNQYLSLFVLMMFIFGVTFEFPVVLVALELAGMVTPRQLLRGWRYALITITVVSAVVTPSSDPFSMMALAIPLTVFYFMAIGIGKLLQK